MTTTAEHIFEGEIAFPFIVDKTNRYEKWSLDFYPKDSADRQAIKATGTKCGIKENKEGNFFYTFTAPADKKPAVTDSDGNPITVLIGNGSKARVKFVVETFVSPTWGNVARTVLTAVVVDKLIPYEKKEVSEVTSTAEKPASAKMPF